MKRSTIVLLFVLLGLLALPFAALADGPAAEPPPGLELPPTTEPTPPPAAEAGPTCPLPILVAMDDDCARVFIGTYSTEEIVSWFAANGMQLTDVIIPADPFLGTEAITLAHIVKYLVVRTDAVVVGGQPVTRILAMATCQAFVKAERLNEQAYYTCIAIVSRATADVKIILCPALDELIVLLGGTTTVSGKKTLESAMAAHVTYCAGA